MIITGESPKHTTCGVNYENKEELPVFHAEGLVGIELHYTAQLGQSEASRGDHFHRLCSHNYDHSASQSVVNRQSHSKGAVSGQNMPASTTDRHRTMTWAGLCVQSKAKN